VYCQLEPDDGNLRADYEDDYEGIRRIFLGSKGGSAGSIQFDWRCVMDARKRAGVDLVLGYNTAVFAAVLRASGAGHHEHGWRGVEASKMVAAHQGLVLSQRIRCAIS
jgi:hypothetical protein